MPCMRFKAADGRISSAGGQEENSRLHPIPGCIAPHTPLVLHSADPFTLFISCLGRLASQPDMQVTKLQLRAASAAQGARSRGPVTVTARAVQFRPCIDIHQVGGAGVGRAAALPPPLPLPPLSMHLPQSSSRHGRPLLASLKRGMLPLCRAR